MKKVRFESPVKTFKTNRMEDSECHFPRPIIERQIKLAPRIDAFNFKPVPYTNDPLQMFECSNSSPCPNVKKTHLSSISNFTNRCSPSDELELSTLDCANFNNTLRKQNISYTDRNNFTQSGNSQPFSRNNFNQILKPIENIETSKPSNHMGSNDDFFLKRDNIKEIEELQFNIKSVSLNKENNPLVKKKEIMNLGSLHGHAKSPSCDVSFDNDKMCRCHHCVQVCHMKPCFKQVHENNVNTCDCVSKHSHPLCRTCNCHSLKRQPRCNCTTASPEKALNSIDKKTWAIEKYEQAHKTNCLDLEIQNSISKGKREPTVSDLFKIIKLQNEQLQLLQKKVDDFISTTKKQDTQITTQPIQNYVTEHIEVESLGTEQKISIGVMTSFEMVRTSTIINKEIVKQNEAQIQCNRSQISIKEVVAKSHPVNLNFLDGLTPVSTDKIASKNEKEEYIDFIKNTDNFTEDKTLNEMSLYNVQVDNAVTPLMSPEQSLYLDVRDYSE